MLGRSAGSGFVKEIFRFPSSMSTSAVSFVPVIEMLPWLGNDDNGFAFFLPAALSVVGIALVFAALDRTL